MGNGSGAAGLAALSVCESILLSLTENGIVDEAEAKAILTDAATAHAKPHRRPAPATTTGLPCSSRRSGRLMEAAPAT